MELNEVRNLAVKFAELLDEKQAQDIVILEVSKQNPYFEYFIIATGQSFVQLRALSEFVDEYANKNGLFMGYPVPGQKEDPWILLDYGDIVVHIFLPETREFYNLEKLWFESPKIEFNQVNTIS